MKFKVGDIVRGIKDAPYEITNEKMKRGEIVELRRGYMNDIRVRIVEHEVKDWIGIDLNVQSQYLELVDEDYEEIHITRKGSEIQAVLKNKGKIVRQSTIKRRTGTSFEVSAKQVIAELFKESFVPHIELNENLHYGVIGTQTKLKDVRGEQLFIGDVVTLVADETNYGKWFVVQDNEHNHAFIMSIESDCRSDGKIAEDWIVIKEKSYKDLENGEKYGGLTAILKEKE